jgi:hypothetical protein
MKTAPSITTPNDKTAIGTVASRHVTDVGTPAPIANPPITISAHFKRVLLGRVPSLVANEIIPNVHAAIVPSKNIISVLRGVFVAMPFEKTASGARGDSIDILAMKDEQDVTKRLGSTIMPLCHWL